MSTNIPDHPPKLLTEEMDDDGRRLLQRWMVQGPASPVFAVLTPGLPVVGQTHADNPDYVVMQRPRVQAVPDGRRQWWLDYTYGSIEGFGGGSAPQWVSGTDRRLELVDVWRNAPFFEPHNFGGIDTPIAGPDGDIGGYAVDAAGEPSSSPHAIHEIVFEYESLSPLSELLISALIRRRNSKPWRGYETGSVVFLGAADRGALGQPRRTALRFAHDEFYHLRQRPWRTPAKQIELDEGHARVVYAVQPFPLLGDFSSLGVPNSIGPIQPGGFIGLSGGGFG